MARKAKKAVKKAAKRAPRKMARKSVAKKRGVRRDRLRVAGVGVRDLPELPPEAQALSRKYGSFW